MATLQILADLPVSVTLPDHLIVDHILPSPKTSGDFSPEDYYWFGYLPSIDDYKIVALFSSINDDDDDDQDEFAHFYMYSLRTGKWKTIYVIASVDFDLQSLSDKTTVIDNVLYWSPKVLDYQQRPKSILAFDLVNEQQKEVPWMDRLIAYADVVFIVVVNGCLALLCHSLDLVCDVWILKQYDDRSSWEKSFSVQLGVASLLNITPNGKLLVDDCGLERSLHHFKLIDISKDTQEQSQRDAYIHAVAKAAVAVDYVVSLISPFGIIKPTGGRW